MIPALRAIALAALLVSGLPGRAAAELDEMTKLIVAYDMTLPKAEKVATFHEAMGKWAKGDPKAVAALAAKLKGASIPEAAAAFEAQPEIKAMLDQAGVSGRDALVLPLALSSTLAAVYAKANGVKMPPEALNQANVDLVMRKHDALKALSQRIREARRALGPGR